MDVFDIDTSGREFFRVAAIEAAHALELFGSSTIAMGSRRQRVLLDLLAGFEIVERVGDVYRVLAVPARAAPSMPPAGWGELADVIRRDRPLVASTGPTLARMHAHLAQAGAAAATETAELLRECEWLVDLGGGVGAYTAAVLAAHPSARATLVDVGEVVPLARDHLATWGDRVDVIDSDIVDVGITGASVALLANVTHLHGPATCEAIVRAAARTVVPGGRVVIKDLRMDAGRPGPLASLVFAVNMALYTDGGDVYETAQLCDWLAGAGLVDIAEHSLTTSPGSVVVIGTRPA